MVFTGFSTDGLISLPPELFTDIIPAITLPSELKVTLHVFYCLNRQRGYPRRISRDELIRDRLLARSFRAISKNRTPEELLDEGLDAAVRRATLLHITQPGDGHLVNWYMVNTEANRAWIEQTDMAQMTTLVPNSRIPEQQPSLLTLYEQNIGLVTPLLMDELRDVEERYPAEWIEAAIREAVRANARSWRYICKVLERWATHGRQHAPNQHGRQRPIDVEKYTSAAFGGLFRLGSDDNDQPE